MHFLRPDKHLSLVMMAFQPSYASLASVLEQPSSAVKSFCFRASSAFRTVLLSTLLCWEQTLQTLSIVRVNFVEAYYLIAVNCHLTLQRYRGSSSGSRSESETPPHWRTELNKTKSYKRNSEDELRDRYEHTLPRHSYSESVHLLCPKSLTTANCNSANSINVLD